MRVQFFPVSSRPGNSRFSFSKLLHLLGKLFLPLMLAAQAQSAGVVYEDAEDGLTAGWVIYDKYPAGAAVENVYDSERNSRVIHLIGNGNRNGFLLRKADGSNLNNSEQRILSWSQRFDCPMSIYVRVRTRDGIRYLKYVPAARQSPVTPRTVLLRYSLGDEVCDGDWHDISRDLAADLASRQPGNELLEVKAFYVRATGWIDDIVLADRETGVRKVYVGENAPPAERHAAEELVKFVRLATGIEMPIVHRYKAGAGPWFIVGSHNDFVAGLETPPDASRLGDDGFELRRMGGDLLLSGATPRGTLYGVYHYLREQLGWEWYGVGDPGSVPEGREDSIPLPESSEIRVPRFRYREVFSPEGGDNRGEGDATGGDFAARLMLNGQLGHRHALKMLDARQGWGMDFLDAYNIGTESAMGARAEEQAIAGLERALTDPVERPEAAQKAGLGVYALIGHIDGSARSEDPADLDFAAKGHAAGAPLFDLTRRVADSVADVHPRVTLLGEAYLWSLRPPANVVLPDNAGVAFAPIEADWSQPLDAGTNQHLFLAGEADQSIQDYLDGWTARSSHIFTWLYATNFSGYLQPLPTIYPMIDSIKSLARRPQVEGIFIQDAYSTRGGSFAALHAWVYGRLLWNPDLDGDALVRRFCDGYYGPEAGPLVYRYIRELHDSATRHPSFIGTKTNVLQPYLTAGLLIEADRLLAQAGRAARNPLQQQRVAIERMGVDWVMLLNGPRLKAEAQAQGLQWPDDGEADRLARLERFAHTVRDVAGMDSLGEGSGSVDDVLEGLRIPRTLPAPPIPCAGYADADCVDLQDIGFELADADLVGDPAASDGSAAHLPGNTDIWGIQVPFQQWLPETGEWALYVRLRVMPGAGAGEDEAALWLGIDPGETHRVPLREIGDGRYHVMRIGEGLHGYDAESYLWFAPPDSSAIDGLYVDRVFAIRDGASRSEPLEPCEVDSPLCRAYQDGGFDLYSGIEVDGEIQGSYPAPDGGDDLDASMLAAWVPDEAASDGHSVWLHRDNAHWAAQLDFRRLLPAQGSWDIYAMVRRGDGGENGGSAFRVGVWGVPGNPDVEVATGQLSDSEYLLVRLPGGGYSAAGDDEAYLWFQTLDASLFIDRLILVAEGEDPARFLGTAPPPQDGVTPEAASAFLARATFGPRMEEIVSLAASGDFEGWIEAQFAKPASSHYDWIENAFSGTPDWDGERDNAHYVRLQAWWDIVVNGEDQLRQRVAFALSEIFVVSSRGPLSNAPDGLADYYDMLVRGAFGNFRDLLLNVARHPMMGRYLSFLGNAKSDGVRHPDENFAREVMQLFSIGLERLNPDGTPMRDANGVPLPTYSQHDITEMARVFTGWSSDDGQFEWEAGWTHESRTRPMVAFEEYHDQGEKRVLGHVIPAGQTAEEDLESAVDILFNHPNTAPFIARRLIQRLVTSNPSPDYVRRVAEAFADNGAGVRGDMQAVVKAVLLDPEVQAGAGQGSPRFGKVREQLLFISNLWRAFHARPGAQHLGGFRFRGYGLAEHGFLNQQGPLTALTVFNFFTPDDTTLALASKRLVAPEMAIMGIDGLHSLLMEIAHETGEYEVHGMTAHLDLSEETRMIEQGEYEALLDRLDLLLLAGHMTDAQRQVLRDYLEYKAGTPLQRRALAQDMVSLVLLSPDYAVQR